MVEEAAAAAAVGGGREHHAGARCDAGGRKVVCALYELAEGAIGSILVVGCSHGAEQVVVETQAETLHALEGFCEEAKLAGGDGLEEAAEPELFCAPLGDLWLLLLLLWEKIVNIVIIFQKKVVRLDDKYCAVIFFSFNRTEAAVTAAAASSAVIFHLLGVVHVCRVSVHTGKGVLIDCFSHKVMIFALRSRLLPLGFWL